MSDAAPLVLGIDSSVPPSSVALVRGERVLGSSIGPFGRGADAWLHGAIAELIASSGYRAAEIDAVVACSGPGAFTGIRVGLATALGLARGIGCPASGLGTLDALVTGMLRQDDCPPEALLLPCIDARRGQVYALLREADPAAAPRWGPEALSPEALLERLGSGPPPLATGTGLDVDPRLRDRVAAVELTAGLASAAALAIAARMRGTARVELPPAVPLYVRAPDARPGTNPLIEARRERG